MTRHVRLLVFCVFFLISGFAWAEPGEHQVIGLHIGIGEYTSGPARLTLHRTTDQHLLPLLGERYGVRWLPSALDVDRDGFRDALLGLLREASRARESGSEVTALLIYTGHGSRVQDQDGDELEGLDETLVTVHGSLTDGTQDVRDDDIYAFRLALADQGIHFTYIAESCHSETSSRGPPTLNIARRGFSIGPSERLFADPAFDKFYSVDSSKGVEMAAAEAIDAASFVSITAAGDKQLARTLMMDQTQWGVLSLAMYRAILEARGPLTSADLFTVVSEQAKAIDRTLKGTPQTPFLHSEGQDAYRAFLGRDPVPFAIRVLAREDSGAVLSAGLEAGITVNSLVGFHHSLDELAADSEPVATAVVTSSSMGRAVVEVSGVERGMFCKVISSALNDCSIFVDPGVPAAIQSALTGRQASKTLVISESFDAALFAVELSVGGSEIEIRWVREPVAEDSTERIPPIARIATKTQAGGWNVGALRNELERLVRIQRLMGVTHRPEMVGVQWGKTLEELEGHQFDDIDIERPTLLVEDGEHYFVKIRNNAETALFFHLIEVFETDTGVLGAQVIPQRPSGIWQSYVRLTAGSSQILSNPVVVSPGATRESVTHLWIATSSTMENLGTLISPKSNRAARGQNPVLDMLSDAAGTRSAVRSDVGEWSARSYRFAIEKPVTDPEPAGS